MDLRPVIWISSVNHLEKYKEIVESSSFWNGGFIRNTPNDFPKIERTPLLYFSQGEITVENNTKLRFNAIKVKNRFSPYYNLNDDLSFSLTHSTIKSIEWYHFKKAYRRHYKKWIRIICNEDIMGGDFLIRAGGMKNTSKLFEMLKQLTEGPTISTSLTNLSNTKMVSVGYVGVILLLIPTVITVVYTVKYGTINGAIVGPISVFLMMLGMIMSMGIILWLGDKSREYLKLKNHFQLISLLFYSTIYLYIFSSHFLGY